MVVRETWISWIHSRDPFFHARFEVPLCASDYDEQYPALDAEREKFGDINIHIMDSKTCSNDFLRRMSILENYVSTYDCMHPYFLMMDQKGFLCPFSIKRDLIELRETRVLLWSAFHCNSSEDNHPDSNFLLMTTNIVRLIVHDWTHNQVLNYGQPTVESHEHDFAREIAAVLFVTQGVFFDDPRVHLPFVPIPSPAFQMQTLCVTGDVFYHPIPSPSEFQVIHMITEKTPIRSRATSHAKDLNALKNRPCGTKSIVALSPGSNTRVIRSQFQNSFSRRKRSVNATIALLLSRRSFSADTVHSHLQKAQE